MEFNLGLERKFRLWLKVCFTSSYENFKLKSSFLGIIQPTTVAVTFSKLLIPTKSAPKKSFTKLKVQQTYRDSTCQWVFRKRDQEWLQVTDRNVIEYRCTLCGVNNTSFQNRWLWWSYCHVASTKHFPEKKIMIEILWFFSLLSVDKRVRWTNFS